MPTRTKQPQPQPKPEPDRLLRIPEAAHQLGVARTTIYEFFADGRLTRVDIGTDKTPLTRVSQAEVTAFIESRKVQHPSARTGRRAA